MGRISAVLAVLAMAGAGREAALGASQETNQNAQINNSINAQQYWFGVAVENISPAVAKQLKLLPEQGVMVIAVFAGSPAEKAGIRAEDLLIEINGKPLTSQEELARAANMPNVVKGVANNKAAASAMQNSEVAYMRAGERVKAVLTPELRPTEMRVSVANPAQNRANQNPANSAGRQAEQRNMVLSNNLSLQYGPGYQIGGQGQGNSKVLREAVSNGSLLITQDTDENGNVIKTTFSNGGNSYVVEPGNVDKLPANLKPLAQQILSMPQGGNNFVQQQANYNNDGAHGVQRVNSAGETDDRFKKLEQQNEELRKQLEEVKRLLLDTNRQATPAGAGK
jgi:membrane-associated protease RseP (regulator of RpoE activity)